MFLKLLFILTSNGSVNKKRNKMNEPFILFRFFIANMVKNRIIKLLY